MIKLSTAILLLVKAEPLVCSLEPNLNEVFVALLSKLECLKSVGYIRVSRSKRNKQKICFKTLDKGRRWKHLIFKGARSTSRMLNTSCHILLTL